MKVPCAAHGVALSCLLLAVPSVGLPLGGWQDSYLGVVHSMMDARVAAYVSYIRVCRGIVLTETNSRPSRHN